MKHSLTIGIVLATALVIISTYAPRYCSVHKTADLCWVQEMGKNGGLGGEQH